MRIDIDRNGATELSFSFVPDELDATVPVPEVWFRLENADKIRSARIALMAYLMARPFLGNTFELSGEAVPSFLGAKLAQDQNVHELFVAPIRNTPERILPDFRYGVMEDESRVTTTHAQETQDRPPSLVCARTQLGYLLRDPSDPHSEPRLISTNVDLFSAFTPEPRLLPYCLIYLCVFDALGVRSLKIPADERVRGWTRKVAALLREVGASAHFEPAGSPS